MTWSPAHLAVEQEDLLRLRHVLEAGNDVEAATATDGPCSAARSMSSMMAISWPAARCTPVSPPSSSPGGRLPAAPLRGMTVVAEAEIGGHWLAAEIMRARIRRCRQPAEQQEGPR